MQTKISRRTVLRGLGAAVSLPLLEAMMPRNSQGAPTPGKPPARMAFFFVPNGMHMPDWTPQKSGADFEIPSTLQPVAKFKDDMTILSGLTLNGGRSLGDGAGDHARCVASFLTGAHPRKTDGKDIKNGVSVDQAAADRIGKLTRLPSLEIGLEPSAPAGHCDSGYSCVYTSNMSWRGEASPMAKEINPAAVFDRLFGGEIERESKQNRARRDHYRKSILDFVMEDAQGLKNRLGARDQQKLEEYLFAVRDIERRIAGAEKLAAREVDASDFPRPAGVPESFEEHLGLLFDLVALAFQTDSTRVVTLMFANAGSNRSYKQIGVGEGHHSLSHHGNNQDKQDQISKINRHHVEQFARLLETLAETKDPAGGRMLDQVMLMYGSGLADGNRHEHDGLPIALFGRGAGTIQPGRHIVYDKETPLCNLYLAMLQRMGVEADRFGDSTGALGGLA